MREKQPNSQTGQTAKFLAVGGFPLGSSFGRLPGASGLTLIELLISMAVLGILGGVNIAVLTAGFDAWGHAQRRLDLQQVSDQMMDWILEGGLDGEGLRDAVELTQVHTDSIEIVPLWIDRSHRPDPIRNQEQKFVLEKQFKPGATPPIGQVRLPDSDEWRIVPISFSRNLGSDPEQPDDEVTFTEEIPPGSAVQIIYTPDAQVHPETIMRFWYDSGKKQVFRSYAGVIEPAFKRSRGVRVERLAFLYYDNLNRLFPVGKEVTPAQRRRITGIKIYLLVSRSREWKELTSFTNVRNIRTIGVTVSEGSTLPLPSPEAIRALSLGDFSQLRKASRVELQIRSDGRARWKLTLEFKPTQDPDRIVLHRFQMEAPPGRIRTSAIMNQTIARNEFVNLLGLDRSGLFDYDDDPDIQDAVLLRGESNLLEVTRSDFEIASIFVRP